MSQPGVSRRAAGPGRDEPWPGDDPWPRLRAWIERAADEPHGGDDMLLATATRGGVPSARVVSLRGIDDRGLRFFTHAGSRKVIEMADNPRAAVVFHWAALRRQLRVEGEVEPLGRAEVESYFATRPRPAQLAACVSRQGHPSDGVDLLRAASARLDRELDGRSVPCPDHFVGNRLVPDTIEFWLGSSDRLHNRCAHLREGGAWRRMPLQP